MSTYNGEKYLQSQLESIFAQNIDCDVDVIVRDDGSSDNTTSILNEYSMLNMLKWYRGENIGPALSFMELLDNCGEYDYYAFADQDDFWLPDKLQKAKNSLMDIEIPGVYFSNAMIVDEQLRPVGRNVYKRCPKLDFYTLSIAGGILGCTMVMNKKMVNIIKKKKVHKNVIMHDFFVAQLCTSIDCILKYDNAPTLLYRQHGNNEVGVSYSVYSKIKERVQSVTTKSKVSIAEQSSELMILYGKYMTNDKIYWLRKVADYKNSFWSRCQLAMSRKIRFINRNMGITLRLAILLGNR